MSLLYLDANSTTRCDPKVLEAMSKMLAEEYSNPSSNHASGWAVQRAIEQARRTIAKTLSVSPNEIYFTSGATESNALALRGVVKGLPAERKLVVSSVTEHASVLQNLIELEREGHCQVKWLEVNQQGQIRIDELKEILSTRTVGLLTLMWFNNEIGTRHPIEEASKLCQEFGTLFHVDAVQGFAREDLNLKENLIDLVSFSAHKIYGPKGSGGLFIRHKSPRIKITPLYSGGDQEKGLRPGTLNAPGIIGLAKACEILQATKNTEKSEALRLSELMLQSLNDSALLKALQVSVKLNGTGFDQGRLSHNLNVTFNGVGSGPLLPWVNEALAVSSGSACQAQSNEPSHVLKAIGLSHDEALSTLRFGISRFTTEAEIFESVRILEMAIEKKVRKKQ